MVILKLDRGLAERLIQVKELKKEQAKNIKGEELTLNLFEDEVAIETRKDGARNYLEISDVNGSFALLVELTKDKFDKIKNIVRRLGP